MKKLVGAAIVVLGLIFYNFFKLPNRADLPGKFEEKAFVRNENNLGTVLLYYAFTVGDTLNADYQALGKTLPFNKTNGITTAFFFHGEAPDNLSLEPPHFDTTRYEVLKTLTIDKVGNRVLTDGLSL
ncbi:hypothetical protein Lbys_0390 [Leadbetterella byssophila DSM 17132]|uniref:Uncharacterized protein n=1 Tax=Leadbetterella byssophila (strain DSM 17132 / JCM 16389 / KACC 11308 / NBRC 106382 / 4M15) TaxID=649349 RepID=E4RW25_LEAB4|nr:hypothetical protein [Leadbetterella byssophila]ADQ16168.1 hypothetical protein Lbys_0390 [Leadbetterella byssophila DSM 17132]